MQLFPNPTAFYLSYLKNNNKSYIPVIPRKSFLRDGDKLYLYFLLFQTPLSKYKGKIEILKVND
jgi:hypothetical protein